MSAWHTIRVQACLQAAWRDELIDQNPAARIRKNPESSPRDRVLTKDEFHRLRIAVDSYPEPYIRRLSFC
ncbi:hypothetical protein JW905_00970 [bacterium]|nr:hypothetical protein [candidate division CSSED10-310 bacterium]